MTSAGPGSGRRVRLYAHRGAAAERPENTLPSFERALELGADALEFDVHATGDGVLVVAHDPDGARMTGVGAALAESRWDDIARWDAGFGFVLPDGSRPFAGRGLRIPTLEEVVTAFPDVPLNVDLKAAIADSAVGLLGRLGAAERTCLASFQVATIRRVRALGYPGPTALARAEVAALLLVPVALARGPLRPRGQAAQLPIRLARPGLVRRCHALGLRVDFWTCNDEALARRLIALGCDGIMTDDPGRIAPIVAEAGRAQAASPAARP